MKRIVIKNDKKWNINKSNSVVRGYYFSVRIQKHYP